MTIASGERLESAPEPQRPERRARRTRLIVAGVVSLAVVAVLLPIGAHGVPPTPRQQPLRPYQWTLVTQRPAICVHVTTAGVIQHTDSSSMIGRGIAHYRVEEIATRDWQILWTATTLEGGACTTTPAPIRGIELTGLWSTLDGTPIASMGTYGVDDVDPSFPALTAQVDPDSPGLFEEPSASGSAAGDVTLPDISGWLRRPDTCYKLYLTATIQKTSNSSSSFSDDRQQVCLDTAW